MPVIQYRLAGLSKLQDAVKLAPGLVASRDAIAVDASLELVKSELVPQIPVGPGHFGYHAKDTIVTRIAGGKRVAGILYTTAPQLRWREGGTKPHKIAELVAGGTQGGSVLSPAWFANAAARHTVTISHPGEKAVPLFKRTLAASKNAIRGIWVGATQQIRDDIANAAR